ncbi:SagB family peptide dehydrogenase [Riemerella columbina]|uniref:SagB family peptide dehydrogenase n=1 Tax=Riemerella columbina TaxID=103810 RepID=UPI0003813381|nr:SagB family peptide dehydrogenase [Riemerella columbina]
MIPILYGKEIIVSRDEFNWIISIDDNKWVSVGESDLLKKFLNIGVILTNEDTNKKCIQYLENENLLIEQKWHIYAALFNFMTKWKDINVNFKSSAVKLDSEDDMKKVIAQNGYPPSYYHKIDNCLDKIALSYEDKKKDAFFDILLKRKTTRNFDINKKMSFEDLSVLLKYTFGIQGTRSLYESDIVSVKKTSPSGGGMHATEVYLLILRVEGIKQGLYHYNVQEDSLHLIKPYSIEEAIEKANLFTVGQEYCTNASVLFFLAHRYFRNFWKYRKNSSAYSVLLREGGHLCQNIYLIATKLNLGVFTAAINHSNIEDELGLNPFEQGISMMAGVGIIDENPIFNLEPTFNEFISE